MLDKLQENIDYKFEDTQYLITALSHSSYSHERNLGKHKSNERFEFLGDSLLGMTVAELIFHKKPELPEGSMTKLRADLVCESNLASVAVELDLGSYILLGRGEIKNGGRDRPSILADALEAVFAAVYLDGGYVPLLNLIEKLFSERINKPEVRNTDYKTMLQEFIQLSPGQTLEYVLIDETGPDHNKYFTVELSVNSKSVCTGTGRSKKAAEQSAAKTALELLK